MSVADAELFNSRLSVLKQPDPPCDACPRRVRCSEGCDAWRYYVSTGFFKVAQVARNLKPLDFEMRGGRKGRVN